jgi:hypothetical protein
MLRSVCVWAPSGRCSRSANVMSGRTSPGTAVT